MNNRVKKLHYSQYAADMNRWIEFSKYMETSFPGSDLLQKPVKTFMETTKSYVINRDTKNTMNIISASYLDIKKKMAGGVNIKDALKD
jgi:hypothetical protein